MKRLVPDMASIVLPCPYCQHDRLNPRNGEITWNQSELQHLMGSKLECQNTRCRKSYELPLKFGFNWAKWL